MNYRLALSWRKNICYIILVNEWLNGINIIISTVIKICIYNFSVNKKPNLALLLISIYVQCGHTKLHSKSI